MKMRWLMLTALVAVFVLALAPTAWAQSATATVTANANLRTGPGTSYAKVGSASAGSKVTLAGCTTAGDWCRLTDGTWVFAELLDSVPAGLPEVEDVTGATPVSGMLPTATPEKAGTGISQPSLVTPNASSGDRLPSIFYDPEAVCQLLAAEGLNALSGLGWDDEALGYFSCVSEDLDVTPGNYSRVGDVPNDVTYMVDSHKEDIVERVYIMGL